MSYGGKETEKMRMWNERRGKGKRNRRGKRMKENREGRKT